MDYFGLLLCEGLSLASVYQLNTHSLYFFESEDVKVISNLDVQERHTHTIVVKKVGVFTAKTETIRKPNIYERSAKTNKVAAKEIVQRKER